MPLHWVSGSSAGAVTAALIAGNAPGTRVERLRAFWNFPDIGIASADPGRHWIGWLGAVQTRLVGSPGQFNPRIPSMKPFSFQSLYDMTPMKRRLADLIDFGRLNSGETRICVAATDTESGEPVIFDSAQQQISIEHIMASCGFLPEFEPVEIDGRLLADGGLSLNAPFDPILDAAIDGKLMLYVVDLYGRDGVRPASLEAAAERKNDLIFGNQTFIRLKYCAEVRELRKRIAQPQCDQAPDEIVLLSYRPGLEEPGPEKSFEFSASAIAQRWKAGLLDMEFATLPHQSQGGIRVVRRCEV